jgi:hypothetical protein
VTLIGSKDKQPSSVGYLSLSFLCQDVKVLNFPKDGILTVSLLWSLHKLMHKKTIGIQ